MGIVFAFIAGTLCTVLILGLLRAGADADKQSELYWEGYERGYSDAAGKARPVDK